MRHFFAAISNFLQSQFELIFEFLFNSFTLAFPVLYCIKLTLPNLDTIQKLNKNPHYVFYDQSGDCISTIGEEITLIDIELIPEYLIHALIAVEDKKFFEHKGVDYLSLIKNFFLNLSKQNQLAGGSTISQQLAKNILQNQEIFAFNDRSILRKIKELFLAYQIEHKYSKKEILYFYLNRVFFGKNCYGIEAASQTYFNKSASSVNLYEAVLLVSLLQSPSKYSQNHSLWKERGKIVLKQMKKLKFISKEEEQHFESYEIPSTQFAKKKESNITHFLQYVTQQIPQQYRDRDLTVYTTLDLDLQEKANQSLQKAQKEIGCDCNSDSAAFVMIGLHGNIMVFIGERDPESHYSVADKASRPIGSIAKCYVYLTAIEKGFNPESLIDDSEFSFGTWSPSNNHHKTQGKISGKTAFAKSVNSPAIRLIEAVTPTEVHKTVQKLGIKDPLIPTLSLALGGLNTSLLKLTQSLLPIPNKGFLPKTFCIEKIIDAKTGELLYKNEKEYKRVCSQRACYYMWKIMKETLSFYGTGRKINSCNGVFGGKSGTSNNNRDLYFMLVNKNFCIGCWFGRKDFAPMPHSTKGNPCIVTLNYFIQSLILEPEDITFNLNIDEINLKTLIDLF